MTFLNSELVQKIFSTIVNDDYFEIDCQAFHLEGFDGRKRHSVMCKCKFDTKANLFVSLPTVTKNIYVTITAGDASLVRQVIATLEDQELESCVCVGNVQLFEEPALRRHMICGVILLKGNLFNALEHLPDELTVGSTDYQLVSVVFLTEAEYEIWKTDGHDGLMDYFEEIDKDLISFGVSGPDAEN